MTDKELIKKLKKELKKVTLEADMLVLGVERLQTEKRLLLEGRKGQR